MRTPTTSGASNAGWTFAQATSIHESGSPPRVLYLESYGSGSHSRVATLIQKYSALPVDLILLDRAHWRWLALTAHRRFAAAIAELDLPPPDAVVLSGPVDVVRLVPALRETWPAVRLIVYFHESQWTYPAENFDPRPYLVGHLEALESADAVWFNSRFHRRVFRSSAWHGRDSRVRALSREIVRSHWHKTCVLYPPVEVSAQPERCVRARPVVTWSARWEPEKRPDIFVDALLQCINDGLDPVIHILGVPAGLDFLRAELPRDIRARVSSLSGFPDRPTYERALAASDLWVSTAEHEFFGVAAIEAALLGVTPVVPQSLAYPETLPSAPNYSPGDSMDLARVISSLAAHRFRWPLPWYADASRFAASRAVRRFDQIVEALVSGG